jgi:hypothetical protein
MLNNTLTLAKNAGGTTVEASITDTDNGTTTRSAAYGGGNRLDLTISRAESTENKGLLSDRYLVRVDNVLTDPNPPYGPAKLSAYLVLVVPRRPDVTSAKAVDTVLTLLCLLTNNSFIGETSALSTPLGEFLTRILNGET